MAKFLEYQGKEFFKQSRIPIPEGIVANTPEEAKAAALKLVRPVVVKAHVVNSPEKIAPKIKELINI